MAGDQLLEFHVIEFVQRDLPARGAGGVEKRHGQGDQIAGGEYAYGISPFRQMLEARSVDIVMIDLVRVGGITQWMKVAGMAEAFNLPVVSHLIPEVHVHLIAAIPNGHIVEYMPWTRMLFDNPPLPVKSEMTVPTLPGLGLTFTRAINDALDRGK